MLPLSCLMPNKQWAGFHLVMESTLMESKYLAKNQLFPAPNITPSHGETVKYPEVTGRQGRIVIARYPGLALGQRLYWQVEGNGTEFSVIEIEHLEPEYQAVLRFDVVFQEEFVVASYWVTDADGNEIGSSESRKYTVLDRP